MDQRFGAKHKLDCGQYYGAILRRAQIGSLLLTETRYPAQAQIPAHAHRNGYFCLVRLGSYHETFGRGVRECGPLTVAFHPPEETHSERMAGTEVRSLNVEVTPSWLARVREAAPALRDPIDSRGGPPAWLALRLYQEFRDGDAVSPLAIEGLLLEIAAELARTVQRPAATPRWLGRARDLLRSRFAQAISLADVAAEAGVHPVHLASVFRRCLGCSVGEFVRNCRVQYAAEQLARRRPLPQIALEAGFADQSHFTRIFKRITGLTPGAYQRTLTG
jgi:AraC family transcriptional regulator